MTQTNDQKTTMLIMNHCVAEGLEPPFISVVIGNQGFGNISRIWLDDDRYWQGDKLAETPHLQAPGEVIHMLIVDGKDQSVSVTVEEDGTEPRFYAPEGGHA